VKGPGVTFLLLSLEKRRFQSWTRARGEAFVVLKQFLARPKESC
jgi:hypothetical protein